MVLTSTTLGQPSQQSIGGGATLAQRCVICHGPTGISRADSPNPACKYASVIYKQLLDFRSGACSSAVMTPLAEESLRPGHRRSITPICRACRPTIPSGSCRGRVVIFGAPLRGITPRDACHEIIIPTN
jgi:hypothetical protein